MTQPRIIVVGSVNTDLVIRVPWLPHPGETVLGDEFFQAAGGKGANQAVAAARLAREPVAFVAAVGDDAFGEQALQTLRRENLELSAVKVVAGMASGVAQIVVDERGENAIAVASGANAALSPDDIDALPPGLFAGARVLLVSLETPLDTVARALQRGKQAGLLTVLNPAPAGLLCKRIELLELVDVLTPNELEAAELTEADANADPWSISAELRRLGARDCAITRGSDGCLVVGEGLERIAGIKVEAVDTTAAGDAFNGALAVALAEGRSLVDAARWANRAAAIAVTRRGAQPSLPTRDELEAIAAV
ncbi:MAG TPA: ribokinase [Pirellulales bacterium]|jgi:ribokinase|nr:ribokinase [Pirellulales bacterium]